MMRMPRSGVIVAGVALFLLATAGALCLAPVSANAKESCLDCHTDAAKLIALIPEREEESGESGES